MPCSIAAVTAQTVGSFSASAIADAPNTAEKSLVGTVVTPVFRSNGLTPVVRLRVRLRGGVALSLHRHHMHNDRAMKILRPAQRSFERLFIVAVHRPDIVKPEIVKYTGRQKARFDALLEPVPALHRRAGAFSSHGGMSA